MSFHLPRMRLVLLSIGIPLLAFGWYLFRPLSHEPVPAPFHLYDLAEGSFVELGPPPEIFAVGLSYAAHIKEAAREFDPDQAPPVFRKDLRSFNPAGTEVRRPDRAAMLAAADETEPGLGDTLGSRFPELPPMLDYEGELGFVLLDDIDPQQLGDPDFNPRLGFLVANDLSARSLALMGEDRDNRYDYWAASKSFPGFLPTSTRVWVPDKPRPNGLPEVVTETIVNGELRQHSPVADMILTPREMLRHIHATFPEALLSKDTLVLTGTPGGVAFATPRPLIRLSSALRWDRFKKLSVKLDGDRSRFLRPGDKVTVRAEGLGEVSVEITGN